MENHACRGLTLVPIRRQVRNLVRHVGESHIESLFLVMSKSVALQIGKRKWPESMAPEPSARGKGELSSCLQHRVLGRDRLEMDVAGYSHRVHEACQATAS